MSPITILNVFFFKFHDFLLFSIVFRLQLLCLREINDIIVFLFNLTVTLAQVFPETLMLGMEIRVKVSDFVVDRIQGLRDEKKEVPGGYQNVACIRTNAMKYLPNFFEKGQVGGCETDTKI